MSVTLRPARVAASLAAALLLAACGDGAVVAPIAPVAPVAEAGARLAYDGPVVCVRARPEEGIALADLAVLLPARFDASGARVEASSDFVGGVELRTEPAGLLVRREDGHVVPRTLDGLVSSEGTLIASFAGMSARVPFVVVADDVTDGPDGLACQ